MKKKSGFALNYKKYKTRFLKWQRSNKLIKPLRSNVPDFVLGLIFNGLIALFLWALAFFGYTTLGLPQRFDYQVIDKQIRKDIPKGYTYSTMPIDKFRGPNTQTLMVVAHSAQYDKNMRSFKPNGEELSDILILFDKTASGYKKSYEFRPVQHSSSGDKNPQYDALITNPAYFDTHFVTMLGHNAILTGWIYVGADASAPIPFLFYDDEGKVLVSSIDPSKPPFGQKKNIFMISNYYDPDQIIPVTEIDGFYTKRSEIAFRYLKDLVCKACSDENTYDLFYYGVSEGKLIYQYSEPRDFKGLDSIDKFLNDKGYITSQ
jgi:hypothetical protein